MRDCGVKYEMDLRQIRYDECGLYKAQWYAYVNTKIIIIFYLPTDPQEDCFKNNIKIYIKTAPSYFCAITIIRKRIILAC